jgi:organic radical activating enzyme
MNLRVKEIFYSLQGEGARTGEASVFVRLVGCNMRCPWCDTDFSGGTWLSLRQIADSIALYPAIWLIWTGGEPTMQLKEKHLLFFKHLGYSQAIETNGSHPVLPQIDYIACSPKVSLELLKRNIPRADEIRLTVQKGDVLPAISDLPPAEHYFLSPVFDGSRPNSDNIDYCLQYILQNPQWKMSIQTHKLINIP